MYYLPPGVDEPENSPAQEAKLAAAAVAVAAALATLAASTGFVAAGIVAVDVLAAVAAVARLRVDERVAVVLVEPGGHHTIN